MFPLNGCHRVDRATALSAGIDNVFNKIYAEHVNAATAGLVGYVNTTPVNESDRTCWVKLDVKH
ncbi:hypothetical protein DVT68_06695 [Dyella solisilvae]|uniref:TonB-dependent receptor n=1 Tax=Dyella solisilvae TaxID=1920168 RepID=A0A370KDH1_9GAMM|nr:hypothetical protein DVT68_06695 [Dyella solisilvae]